MYARDPSSKAVINMDDGYYKAIQARRVDAKQREMLECQVEDLKCELEDIKTLLQQILSGKNHV